MGREFTGDSEREERRNQILLDYVEALEAGTDARSEPAPGGAPGPSARTWRRSSPVTTRWRGSRRLCAQRRQAAPL